MDVVVASRGTSRGRQAAVGGPGRVPARRSDTALWRLIQFGLVGAGGTVVNMMVFAAATASGLPYLAAAFVAMEIATGFNFALSERTVFIGRGRGRRWVRLVSFFAVATAGFTVTGPLMLALIALSVPPVPADALAIGALTAVRFVIADRLIWTKGRRSTVAGR